MHYLILGVYNGYGFNKFKNLIEWVVQKKLGFVEVFIDLKKLGELKTQADESEDDLFKLLSEIPKFLIDSPEQIIPALSLCLQKLYIHKLEKPPKLVIPRFYNMENITNLADIKSNVIGNFITIKGVVLGNFIKININEINKILNKINKNLFLKKTPIFI